MESNPWPHNVVDNFYDECLFDKMLDEILLYQNTRHYYNRLIIRSDQLDFNKLFPNTLQCLSSKNYYRFLDQFNKIQTEDSSVYHEIAIISRGYYYPIHDENPNKILSFITYLHPSNSIGTLLYDKNKIYAKEVEWNQNTTLVFAGIPNVTWHNYKVDNGIRITVNTFIINR